MASDVTPEVQARLRGLENHAKGAASAYCRPQKATEEIQARSPVHFDISPSSRCFLPALPMRGFTEN